MSSHCSALSPVLNIELSREQENAVHRIGPSRPDAVTTLSSSFIYVKIPRQAFSDILSTREQTACDILCKLLVEAFFWLQGSSHSSVSTTKA